MQYRKEDAESFFVRNTDKSFEQSEFWKISSVLPQPKKNGPWICGGVFRRIVTRQNLFNGDIDFFCRDPLQKIILIKKLKKLNNSISPEIKIQPLKSTKWATTFQVRFPWNTVPGSMPVGISIKVQVIHGNYWNSIEGCMDSFDFSVCQYGYNGTDIISSGRAIWDMRNNEASIIKDIDSLIKNKKYAELRSLVNRSQKLELESFKINKREILKIEHFLNNLTNEDLAESYSNMTSEYEGLFGILKIRTIFDFFSKRKEAA